MPELLRMPAVAANSTETVISSWAVREGGAFAAGDPIVSVEMEKAIVDVPAEAAGVLVRQLVEAGSLVAVGAPIALLGAPDEIVDDVDRALAALGFAGLATGSPAPGGPGAMRGPSGRARLFASPAARRVARTADVDLARVVGTGPGGRIRIRDVEAAVAARASARVALAAAVPGPAAPTAVSAPVPPVPAPASPTPAPAGPVGGTIAFPAGTDEVLVPISHVRRAIAAQVTPAREAPHAYVAMEIDASRLVSLREGENAVHHMGEPVGLGLVPFVVKASTEALKRNPTFNGQWTEQGLLAKRRINVGVTILVDEGVIIPVIRDAGELSIHGISQAIADAVARGRAGTLRVDDFTGGTFTVDTTGHLGANLVMPMLNVPEVGIVSLGAITKRAVVITRPDGDVIAIRSMMNMVLGIDHRANDGAAGAALLRDIKAWLEAVGPETAIS